MHTPCRTKGYFSVRVVAQQLERVIMKLLRAPFAQMTTDKILSCLRAYRAACIERMNPHLYNDFIREFKYTLPSLKKEAMLVDVAEAKLGLVSKEEHRESKVDDDEAKAFLLPEEDTAAGEAQKDDDKTDDDEDMVSCSSRIQPVSAPVSTVLLHWVLSFFQLDDL